MRYLLAILIAAAPVSAALAQDGGSTAEPARLNGREINDMFAAGKVAEVVAIIDPVIDAYDRRYAGGTRPRRCRDDGALPGFPRIPPPADIGNYEMVEADWCFALWAKGYALADVRDFRGALPFLERATTMAPGNSAFLSELGTTYGELGRWSDALDAYRRSVAAAERLQPASRKNLLSRALFGFGYCLVELKRWDEAETAFNRLLEVDPENERARNELDYIRDNRP